MAGRQEAQSLICVESFVAYYDAAGTQQFVGRADRTVIAADSKEAKLWGKFFEPVQPPTSGPARYREIYTSDAVVTATAARASSGTDVSAVLAAGQTGVGDSSIVHTNLAQDRVGPGAIVITSTVGATPTVTIAIQGSVDGVSWTPIPYALPTAPNNYVTAAIVITTAATTVYYLSPPAQPNPYVFVKLALSANTNVTVSASYYV